MLQDVLNILSNEQQLPAKYKDHALSGNYGGQRECHITPDRLLIYKNEREILAVKKTWHDEAWENYTRRRI